MASWFNCKIRFQTEDEAGRLKTINESYLVDAVSHTEAEARITSLSGNGIEAMDFTVKRIVPMQFTDVFFYPNDGEWYRAKVTYESVDDKSGKEKRVVCPMLVQANSVEEAYSRVNDQLKTMLIPYRIEGCWLTAIVDVFPYESSDEQTA